jgi:hypothetical protein
MNQLDEVDAKLAGLHIGMKVYVTYPNGAGTKTIEDVVVHHAGCDDTWLTKTGWWIADTPRQIGLVTWEPRHD